MDKGSSTPPRTAPDPPGEPPAVPHARALVATFVLLLLWAAITWKADLVAIGLARATTDAETLFGLDRVPAHKDD